MREIHTIRDVTQAASKLPAAATAAAVFRRGDHCQFVTNDVNR